MPQHLRRNITSLLSGLFLCTFLSPTLYSADAQQSDLTWVGCGITKKAFMSELAQAYEEKHNVSIELKGGGATKGIREISSKQADIGGSCRPKLRGTLEEASARMSPVAWDALVIITHPDNPITDISIDELRAVYDGLITNWNQLGGANEPIHLLTRKSKISGVGLTLRQLVFSDLERNFASYQEFPSTGPLEQALEKDPLGLAVTGISSARKRNVKMLNLEGKEPSFENIRTGAYLLYRPLYITYNITNPNYLEVKKFVDFAHSSEGREIIRAQKVVPYLDALALIHKQRLQWEEASERRKLREASLREAQDRMAEREMLRNQQ